MRRAATHVRRVIRTYATKRSPYAVLGLDRGATEREIKNKFRALAKALHPDTRAPDAAGDLGEVLEAYASFCLLYTSPSPRDGLLSRMPSSA